MNKTDMIHDSPAYNLVEKTHRSMNLIYISIYVNIYESIESIVIC